MDRINCTNENGKRHDEDEICWMRINYETTTQKNRVKLFESAQIDLTESGTSRTANSRELSANCVVACLLNDNPKLLFTLWQICRHAAGAIAVARYIFARVNLLILFRQFLSIATGDLLVRWQIKIVWIKIPHNFLLFSPLRAWA